MDKDGGTIAAERARCTQPALRVHGMLDPSYVDTLCSLFFCRPAQMTERPRPLAAPSMPVQHAMLADRTQKLRVETRYIQVIIAYTSWSAAALKVVIAHCTPPRTDQAATHL